MSDPKDTNDTPGLADAIEAIKQAHPGITDDAAKQYYNDMQAASAKLMGTINRARPQPANIDNAPLNTQLADPYAGAGYTQADLMKQFSPEQLNAAYAQQQALYKQSQPLRAIGGILAGSSGSADVMNKNQTDWEGIDKQNLLQSIDRQKALQDQATAGLNAGTKAQTMAKTAGEYTGTQQAKQEEINQARQKTATGDLTLATQQRLRDPKSNDSLILKNLLMDQLATAHRQLPAGINADTLTGEQIMNMGILDPKVLDAYKKQVGIVSDEAKARTDQAVAQEITGGTRPTMQRAPDGSITFNVAGNPAGFRQQLVDSLNKGQISQDVLDAFDEKYPQANAPQLTGTGKDRLKYATISANGITLPPNPIDVAKAEGAGKQAATFDEQVRTYKTQVEPYIDAALTKLDTTSAGKGTNFISRWLPGNEQQELVNLLAQVNNTYPGALPANIASNIVAAQKAGGFTGSPLESMTNDQIRAALNRIKGVVANQINYQKQTESKQPGEFGKTQTVSPQPQPNAAPAGTVEMTKNGKTYDIPADKVSAAEAQGYKRK